MMTNKSPNLRTAVVQTNLRVVQLQDEIIVACDRGSQTITTTPPFSLNKSVYELLEYTPYSEIVKGSNKVFDLPRKPFLQFDFDRSSAVSWRTSYYKSSLKKSASDSEGLSGIHVIFGKMEKSVADQDCQTTLSVSPFVLDDDSVASVYNELSVQTSITFEPGESLSFVAPKLRQILQHTKNCQSVMVDGKIVTGFDEEDEIEVTKLFAQPQQPTETTVQEETKEENQATNDDTKGEAVIREEALNIKDRDTNTVSDNQKTLYLTDEEFERNVQMILDKTVKNVYDFLMKVLEIYNRADEPPKTKADNEKLMEQLVAPEMLESKWLSQIGSNISTASKEAMRMIFPDRVLEGDNINLSVAPQTLIDSGEEQLDETTVFVPDANSTFIDDKSNIEENETVEECRKEEDAVEIVTLCVDDTKGRENNEELSSSEGIGAPEMLGDKRDVPPVVEQSDDKQDVRPEDTQDVPPVAEQSDDKQSAPAGVEQSDGKQDALPVVEQSDGKQDVPPVAEQLVDEQNVPPVAEQSIQDGSQEKVVNVGEIITEESPADDKILNVQADMGASDTIEVADNKEHAIIVEDSLLLDEPLAKIPEEADIDEAVIERADEMASEQQGATNVSESDINRSFKLDEVKTVTFASQVNRFGDSGSNQGDKHIDCECGKLHEGGAAPPALSQPPEQCDVKFELTLSKDDKTVEKTLRGVVFRATISCPDLRPTKASGAIVSSLGEKSDKVISLSVTIPRDMFTSNAVQLSNDAINESVLNTMRVPDEPKQSVQEVVDISYYNELQAAKEIDHKLASLETATNETKMMTKIEAKTLADVCDCRGPAAVKENKADEQPPIANIRNELHKVGICYCDLQESEEQSKSRRHMEDEESVQNPGTLPPPNICSCTSPKEITSPDLKSNTEETSTSNNMRDVLNKSTEAPEKLTDPALIYSQHTNPTSADFCECIKLQERTTVLLKTHTSAPSGQLPQENICGCRAPLDTETISSIPAKLPPQPDIVEEPIFSESQGPLRKVQCIQQEPSFVDACTCKTKEKSLQSKISQYEEPQQQTPENIQKPGDLNAIENATSKETEMRYLIAALDQVEQVEELPFIKSSAPAYLCSCGKLRETETPAATDENVISNENANGDETAIIDENPQDVENGKVDNAIVDETGPEDEKQPSEEDATCDEGSVLTPDDFECPYNEVTDECAEELPSPRVITYSSTPADVCDCSKPQGRTPSATKTPVLLKRTEQKENYPLADVCDCNKPQASITVTQPCAPVVRQYIVKSNQTLENFQNRFAAVCDCGKQQGSSLAQPAQSKITECDEQQLKIEAASNTEATDGKTLTDDENLQCDVIAIGEENAPDDEFTTCNEVAIGEENAPDDEFICDEAAIGDENTPDNEFTCNEIEVGEENASDEMYICDEIAVGDENASDNEFTCNEIATGDENTNVGNTQNDVIECTLANESLEDVCDADIQKGPPIPSGAATTNALAAICECCKKLLNMTRLFERGEVIQDERITAADISQTSTSISQELALTNICACLKSEVKQLCGVSKVEKASQLELTNQCASTRNNLIDARYKQSIEKYMQNLVYNDCIKTENANKEQLSKPEETTCTSACKRYKSIGDKGVERLEKKKMETLQEEGDVEVLYVRNEAPAVLDKTPPRKSGLKSCVCKQSEHPVIKTGAIYEDDSDYNENYMEELMSDVMTDVSSKVVPDSTHSIPPYLTDTDRCDSKMEMPWLQISLPPLGYYEIKNIKGRPKNVCNCWDVDKKDSILKAVADKSEDQKTTTKCDCTVEKNRKMKTVVENPQPNNICHCLPCEVIDAPPPKMTEPNPSCICFENIIEKIAPSVKPKDARELNANILCRCLEDKDADFEKGSLKFVYDTDCYGSNEPYMDPLNRQFADDCDSADCGPNSEIVWTDIIIPKNVKLRQAKKRTLTNVAETEERVENRVVNNSIVNHLNVNKELTNAEIVPLAINLRQTQVKESLAVMAIESSAPVTVSNVMQKKSSKLLSSKINIGGHISVTEYEEKQSFADVSNIIKIEGGAASLQTLSAMSTISNVRMKLKRVTKDYVITIHTADGKIQEKSGSSILKPIGSEPFVAQLGPLGVVPEKISKVVISLKPQSDQKVDAEISQEQNAELDRKAKSVPVISSKELAVIDMAYQDSQTLDQKITDENKNAIKSDLLTEENKQTKQIKPVKSFEYRDPVIAALETYRAEMKPLQESLNRLKAKIGELGIPELNNWNQSSEGNTCYCARNGNANTFDHTPDFNYTTPPSFPQQMSYGMNSMQLPYSQGYYPTSFGYPQANMYAPPAPQPHYQNMLYPDISDWKSMHKRAYKNHKCHTSRHNSSSKSSSDVSDYDTFSGEDSRSSAIESAKATSNDDVSSSRNSLRRSKCAKQNKYQNTNKVDFSCDEDCSAKSNKSGRSDFVYHQSDSERFKTNQLFKGQMEKNQNVKKCHKFKVALRLHPSNQEVMYRENLTADNSRSGENRLL